MSLARNVRRFLTDWIRFSVLRVCIGGPRRCRQAAGKAKVNVCSAASRLLHYNFQVLESRAGRIAAIVELQFAARWLKFATCPRSLLKQSERPCPPS